MPLPDTTAVAVTREDGIAWVVMNRPDKRNAMNPAMHREMCAVLPALADDPETHALVLAGAGGNFSSGEDLKESFLELRDRPDEQARVSARSHEWRYRLLRSFPKPTVAMVEGSCYGAALTQLYACDVVVAARTATFAVTEIDWGLVPGGMLMKALTELFPLKEGLYYALSGETFDGDEARRLGVATFVVEPGESRSRVSQIASKLAQKNPVAYRGVREAFHGARRLHPEDAFEYALAKAHQARFLDRSDDASARVESFVRRDPPPQEENQE